jgi:hypothetical protein
MSEITGRIESWRRERRLTVRDLARAAHMSPETCKRRRRRGDWRDDDLVALAQALRIKVEWLTEASA